MTRGTLTVSTARPTPTGTSSTPPGAGRAAQLRHQRPRHRRQGRRRRRPRRLRRRRHANGAVRPTTSSCCGARAPSRTRWPSRPAFVALLHGTLDQARTAERRRPASARRRCSASTTTRTSTAGWRSTASAATTTSRSTTTAPSPRSTAARATTRSRSASSSARQRDAIIGGLAPADVFDTRRHHARLPQPRASASRWSPRAARGDDTFTVYSNQAELRLEGDAGNDLFIVRAFALAETDPRTARS